MKLKNSLTAILAIMSFSILVSCEKSKEEVKEDPRLKYVGSYSLSATASDFKITDSSGSKDISMAGYSNKTLNISINTNNDKKLNVSGYYGNIEATLYDDSDGGDCILFDDVSFTNYQSGVLYYYTIKPCPAKFQNGKLVWEDAAIATGTNGQKTIVITGIYHNTASKN